MKIILILIVLTLTVTQCNPFRGQLYPKEDNKQLKENQVVIRKITTDTINISGKRFVRVLTNRAEIYLLGTKIWIKGDTLELE